MTDAVQANRFDTTGLPPEAADYIAELEDKIMESVDRQASSRDSIVRMRQRARETLIRVQTLEHQLEDLRNDLAKEQANHEAYVEGILRAHRAEMLDILTDK